MQHIFDIEVAVKYGVEIAIFLKNLSYWIKHNADTSKNFHQNRYWSYNTIDSFTKTYPYWKKGQIERLLNKMIKLGLILKGNFSSKKSDRTCFYALTDLGLEAAPILISRKREMDFPKTGNGFPENGKCNRTNNKTYNKTNNNYVLQEKQKPPLANVETRSNSYRKQEFSKPITEKSYVHILAAMKKAGVRSRLCYENLT